MRLYFCRSFVEEDGPGRPMLRPFHPSSRGVYHNQAMFLARFYEHIADTSAERAEEPLCASETYTKNQTITIMRISKLILSSAALAMGLIATAPNSQAQG